MVEIPIGLGKNKDYVTLVSLAEYFKFITDEQVGTRHNDLDTVLPELEKLMTKEAFEQLHFVSAPADFLNHLSHYSHDEF